MIRMNVILLILTNLIMYALRERVGEMIIIQVMACIRLPKNMRDLACMILPRGVKRWRSL
jgi:hypothetical protein